jgi:hypothetical protein
MRQPQHLSHEQQRQCDRLQDVGSALAAVRKAAAGGDRLAIQASCGSLARRLAVAPIDGGDEDEICATIRLIETRTKFGVPPRLRRFLLPLVAAVEWQIEEAEADR